MRGPLLALGVLTMAVGAELCLQGAQPDTGAPKSDKSWSVPRTADGHPDLRGTWSATDWASVPIHKSQLKGVKNPTGDVPNYWYERGTAGPDRPFMMLDPADGVLPVRPEAIKGAQEDEWVDAARLNFIQQASELDHWSRCISRGPFLLIPTSYNSGTQIVQTRDSVAILSEMIHETRVIHLGGQHPPSDVRLWLGDSRGRWEGDTLVVDVTNFAEPPGRMISSVFKTTGVYTGPGATLHVTERFRLVGPDKIDYRATVEDPAVFTRPFTFGFPLRRDAQYEIYEYACQEGNHFIENVLSAARAREKARASAKK